MNITNQIRQKRASLILPYLQKEFNILDAGSGDGWFVYVLREKGYNCIGFDKSDGDLRKLPFKLVKRKIFYLSKIGIFEKD